MCVSKQSSDSPRVIALDRDEDNLLVLCKALQLFGCQAIALQEYDRLLVSVRVHRPVAVFMGVALWETAQLQALQQLASGMLSPRVPAIVLTGHTRECDRDRLLALGCDALISKPYMLDDLKGAVERFVSCEIGSATNKALPLDLPTRPHCL